MSATASRGEHRSLTTTSTMALVPSEALTRSLPPVADGATTAASHSEGSSALKTSTVSPSRRSIDVEFRTMGKSPGYELEGGLPRRPSKGAPRFRPRSDNLSCMSEISATDAARNFADLLDAIEHRGEHFTIVRRGKAIAHLEPVSSGRGSDVKRMLSDHPVDSSWSDDLAAVREIVELQHRR